MFTIPGNLTLPSWIKKYLLEKNLSRNHVEICRYNVWWLYLPSFQLVLNKLTLNVKQTKGLWLANELRHKGWLQIVSRSLVSEFLHLYNYFVTVTDTSIIIKIQYFPIPTSS